MLKMAKNMLFVFVIINSALLCIAGVLQSQDEPEDNKERESDGAYSPRHRPHLGDGKEHDTEFGHQAVLGSQKEAEEYDTLPPEEAKRRLRILLGKMDLNKDQRINKKELKAWIIRSFKMLSEEEATDRFEDSDVDGDELISWKEYLSGFGDSDENNLIVDDDHLLRDDKEIFEAADLDKNGFLTKSEFIAFSHPEDHPAMIPLIVNQTLRNKDKDNDGAINFQEFVGEEAKEKNQTWLIQEKQRFDRDFDINGDGVLKGDELLSWLLPSQEQIAEDEVEHLFEDSDDNGDNTLTFDEVLDHHDVFVGSEVTDYGEHLHNIHHFAGEL